MDGLKGTNPLRRKAEQVLRNQQDEPAASPNDLEVRKQLHELQVNQIELSLQNSELLELQQARQKIESMLARYTDLYEFAPIGYFTLDKDGTLREANLTGAGLLGLERAKLVGRRFGAFVAVASRPIFNAFLGRVFTGNAKQSCEVRLLNARQGTFFAHIEANADPAELTCRLVVEDINARKMAEQALQNAHDQLEAKVRERTAELTLANAQLKAEVAEHKRTEAALKHTQHILNQAQKAAHVGSWERDMSGGIPSTSHWSDELFRICGLPPQAFAPNLAKLLRVIHADDRKAAYRMIRRAIEQRQNFSISCRVVRPDGTVRHVRLQGNILYDAEHLPQTMVGSVLDITDFKRTEAALLQSQETIRRLAAHQEQVKEGERKRIAREIHDELGQNLLALRIDVSMLATRTEHSHPHLHAKVQAALDQIDTTIKSVRGIINNLRPAVLDLGLPAAFEWQIKEFQRRNGIACTLRINGKDADYQLDDKLATALFRILQESLTNVSRHARADQVTVMLSREGDKVLMKVADNGIGMQQNCRRKTASYGLIGIQERITTLHGELSIESSENRGTTLSIVIPARCQNSDAEARITGKLDSSFSGDA